MCGIAGIFQFASPINTKYLKLFNDSLIQRGPDDLGFLSWSAGQQASFARTAESNANPHLGLVHRRLSILDLTESGSQPMGSEDGRYYIVFNGEIYNYLELKLDLEKLGYRFRSHSDTEVLLYSYIEWGANVLKRLIGMFAFAVLDTKENKMFLARDFFGIKPLYYTSWQDGFAFASEIKTLLQLPWVSSHANPQQVYDYLRYEMNDADENTFFADIKQVPSAHYLEIPTNRRTQATPVRYWQINTQQTLDISFDEAANRLRDMFLENIDLHLRSDVPVGAALSGGIDSSAVVMAMRHLKGNCLQLHTFSYIADEAAINEEKWLDMAAKAASAAKQHKVWLNPELLLNDLERLIYVQDEPFGSTSMYAQFCVFRLAQENGIKVLLEGQGADELLAGYMHFLPARLASLIIREEWKKAGNFLQQASHLPGTSKAKIIHLAGNLLLPFGLRDCLLKITGGNLLPPWLNSDWFMSRRVKHGLPWQQEQNTNILRSQLHTSFTRTILPKLLQYGDRNSMAFSVESRVPFLTPGLADFVFSLPEEYLIAQNGTTKAVFRQAMRGIVPDPILDRKDKIGFVTPLGRWLSSIDGWVNEIMESEAAQRIPLIKTNVIKQEWQAVLSGHKPFDNKIWRCLNLILWTKIFNVTYD